MGKAFFFTALLAFALLPPFLAGAQDLSLSPEDLRIELRADGGYHLFIRYKPDISSVLITESTRDPNFRTDNYAYRAAEKNAVNGDEIRLINGFPIPAESGIYSLVSSTPVWHPSLGWAYHIYIPYKLLYGYEGGRRGEVQVGDGTYLNVRAFYYAYADYRGAFRDNPFILRVSQEPKPAGAAGTYLKETVDAFTEIAGENVIYSKGPSDLAEHIGRILEKENGKKVDIVICFDATNSMKPYIDAVRAELIPILQGMISGFSAFRIGLVLYKDYYDDFLNRVFPFTADFGVFRRNLNAVRVGGGGDIPEAVYEALYAGAVKFPWNAESKIMILIGDAPPHPRPRGKITKQMVDDEVKHRGIKVNAIILPQ
ncbi:MAG: VWA domain-containing protein [Treponema sp.]|nr:VWA domain-containing protein [Treponema sp.]